MGSVECGEGLRVLATFVPAPPTLHLTVLHKSSNRQAQSSFPALALALLISACSTPAPKRSFPVSAPTSVAIPDLAARLERLGERLEAERQSLHIPGMAVAIVKDDHVIWAEGFGLSDVETQRAATPETLFAIGSTTKAFTATLIGMLVDEGKLAWDEPVTRVLPNFRLQVDTDDPSSRVTLRDLLSHRTGFTRMGVLWAAGTVGRARILEAATHAKAWAPFRSGFHYNNVMVMAAGEAAAQVEGTSWEELLRKRILLPLHMGSTDASIEEAQRSPLLATGYDYDEDSGTFRRQTMRRLASIAPAGAINSNVLDMAEWIRLLLGRGRFESRELVSEAQLQETWTPAIQVGPGMAYGMGWFLSEWQGRKEAEHGGNIDGFAAEVALLPEEDLGFVLLTNVSSTILQRTSRQIVWEALLGEDSSSVSDATAGDEAQAEGDKAQATPRDTPEDVVGTYIADFAAFHGAPFVVKVQNDRLAVDIPGQTVFELLPETPDGKHPFALVPDQIQVAFERDESGGVVGMKMFQAGLTFEIPREGIAIPADGTAEDFAPYIGTYRDPAIGDVFPIVVHNGRLACDYPKQMVYDLRLPNEEGLWIFRVTDQLGISFNRDDFGEVESITFHERGTTRICPRIEEGRVMLPTADEILVLRRAKETGERLRELGTLELSGKTFFVNAGIEGTHRIRVFADGGFEEENHFEPFGWSKTGYDGSTGWTESAFDARKELHGKYLEQLALSSPAVLFGDWSETFDSIDVVRRSESGGRLRWVVRLVKGDLPPWEAYVDAETGDVIRVESQVLLESLGALSQRTILEDYRDEHGIQLPHRISTENDSTGRVVVEFD